MKQILLTISIFVFGLASAQNIFQDSFATYNTAVQLSGQGTWSNNSTNPGGLGACTGAICANTKVLASGVDYTAYGTSANSVELRADSDSAGRGFTAVSSGDLYVGMLLNLSSALTGSNDFFRVMSGGNFSASFRMSAKNNGGSFFLGFSKGTNGTTVYTTNSYGYGQNHLVIFKYAIRPGTTDDLVSIYVDPDFAAGIPIIADAQTSTGTDQTAALDRLSFRQNSPTGTAGKVGLISVSSTWAGLAFPNLKSQNFDKSTFKVIANNSKSGILSINSKISLENAKISIYNVFGKVIESKKVSLEDSVNEIAIKPIRNSGIYIVEIVVNDKKFTQKIIVN